MVTCTNCGSPVLETEDRCFGCGAHVGFPNVMAAEREQSTLAARYAGAFEAAKRTGREDALTKFDVSMRNTVATINVDLRFLHFFFTSEKQVHSTYQLGVRAQTRKAAGVGDDRHRTGVEGTLFGTYGERIRYAALSLDGVGLKSYGEYAIRLRDIAVRDRASLLEENSYKFVEHHAMTPGTPDPLGYRATWATRHELAVAKLGAAVSGATIEASYAGILLRSNGNRSDDDFIEVHIYGPVDQNAVESVRGKSKLKKQPDRAFAASARECVLKAGKTWIEG